MTTISERLTNLQITIPQASAPAANYVISKRIGNLVYTSGQLPLVDGKLVATGIVGNGVDLETARDCARACAVNVLAVAKAAVGDLENIKSVVKISVFVASAPDFTEQHLVANGGSDLLVDVLGDGGRHARSAVGVPSLPLNAPVEIEAIFEV